MKAKNSKVLLGMCMLALQLSTFSTASMAKEKKGGMDGGGGDALVNSSTGEVVSIADPLATEIPQGRRIVLQKTLKDELLKVKKHAENYFFSGEVFETLTSEENVVYFVIDELPTHDVCNERIKYNMPSENGLSIVPAACTIGKKTWIKKSIYNQLVKKPSQRELALLIVHEGLRRVPNLTNDDLTAITNGLRETLALSERQIKGELDKISEDQKDGITEMLESILLNNLSDKDLKKAKNAIDNYKVSDHGGLVSQKSVVEEGAVVGAGSIVKFNTRITGDSQILGSNCSFMMMIGKDITGMTYDEYNEATTVTLKNVKLINSQIEQFGFASLFENLVIENSVVKLRDVGSELNIINSYVEIGKSIGKNAVIKNASAIIGEAGDNLKITSSSISPKNDGSRVIYLEIGNNFELSNSKITFSEERYARTEAIPDNVSFKNVNANFNSTADLNDVVMLGSLGALSNGKLKFQPGLKIDFQGKTVCQNGKVDQFQTGQSRVKIKTQNDLVKYCK